MCAFKVQFTSLTKYTVVIIIIRKYGSTVYSIHFLGMTWKKWPSYVYTHITFDIEYFYGLYMIAFHVV